MNRPTLRCRQLSPRLFSIICRSALSVTLSHRDREDQRLLGQVKHSWFESGDVYGYRKIHLNLGDVVDGSMKPRMIAELVLDALLAAV